MPGIINVDFADVKTIMQNAGSALMGIGYGQGEKGRKKRPKWPSIPPCLIFPLKGPRVCFRHLRRTGPYNGRSSKRRHYHHRINRTGRQSYLRHHQRRKAEKGRDKSHRHRHRFSGGKIIRQFFRYNQKSSITLNR